MHTLLLRIITFRHISTACSILYNKRSPNSQLAVIHTNSYSYRQTYFQTIYPPLQTYIICTQKVEMLNDTQVDY